MRLATWNVNGLRARLDFVRHWLRARRPDVVGLQELKLTDEQFPHAELEELGYRAAVHGQKGWNGVAVLSRAPGEVIQRGLPGQDDWYVLADLADQYLLLYYCGTSPMSAYRGAVVMSRVPSTQISPDAINIFNAAFASSGLPDPPTMDDFCVPDNSACLD